MTGYKAIIKNMVEAEVTRFVEKKSGKFIEVKSVELSTNSGFDTPTFDVEIVVGLADIIKRDFLIHGYVSEYGSVVVTSIMFDRMIKKANEEDFKKVSEFLVRDEIVDFKFDR